MLPEQTRRKSIARTQKQFAAHIQDNPLIMVAIGDSFCTVRADPETMAAISKALCQELNQPIPKRIRRSVGR